jgi:hypothetical protein
MRQLAPIILRFSVFALIVFGSCAWGEALGSSEISFSYPFACDMEEPYCLADSFQAGLKVVMLSTSGMCAAKTGKVFKYEHHVEDFEATRVIGTKQCPVFRDETPFGDYRIAVIGGDPGAVQLAHPSNDKSPVSKEIELKARKIAAPEIEKLQKISDLSQATTTLSNTPPKVIRVGDITLLTFELTMDGEPWEPGPTVVITKAGVFLLQGACTYGEPVFFSVDDKLYIAYTATMSCCACGDINHLVCDLSGKTPNMVYVNSNFSD